MIELDPVLAVIGPKALHFLYAWLVGCMIASTAAGLKGYNERYGLATGLFLSILGGVIWMFMPWRRESRWDRAVRPTDLVTIAGGFLLLASAFMKWFESDEGKKETLLSGRFPLGVVALLAALAAISHVLLAASEAGPGWILDRGRLVVLILGVAALIATVIGVMSPPSGDEVKLAAYIGIAGAVLAIVGPLLARLAPFPRASQMEHGPLPA
jgi:hypothetical protein